MKFSSEAFENFFESDPVIKTSRAFSIAMAQSDFKSPSKLWENIRTFGKAPGGTFFFLGNVDDSYVKIVPFQAVWNHADFDFWHLIIDAENPPNGDFFGLIDVFDDELDPQPVEIQPVWFNPTLEEPIPTPLISILLEKITDKNSFNEVVGGIWSSDEKNSDFEPFNPSNAYLVPPAIGYLITAHANGELDEVELFVEVLSFTRMSANHILDNLPNKKKKSPYNNFLKSMNPIVKTIFLYATQKKSLKGFVDKFFPLENLQTIDVTEDSPRNKKIAETASRLLNELAFKPKTKTSFSTPTRDGKTDSNTSTVTPADPNTSDKTAIPSPHQSTPKRRRLEELQESLDRKEKREEKLTEILKEQQKTSQQLLSFMTTQQESNSARLAQPDARGIGRLSETSQRILKWCTWDGTSTQEPSEIHPEYASFLQIPQKQAQFELGVIFSRFNCHIHVNRNITNLLYNASFRSPLLENPEGISPYLCGCNYDVADHLRSLREDQYNARAETHTLSAQEVTKQNQAVLFFPKDKDQLFTQSSNFHTLLCFCFGENSLIARHLLALNTHMRDFPYEYKDGFSSDKLFGVKLIHRILVKFDMLIRKMATAKEFNQTPFDFVFNEEMSKIELNEFRPKLPKSIGDRASKSLSEPQQDGRNGTGNNDKKDNDRQKGSNQASHNNRNQTPATRDIPNDKKFKGELTWQLINASRSQNSAFNKPLPTMKGKNGQQCEMCLNFHGRGTCKEGDDCRNSNSHKIPTAQEDTNKDNWYKEGCRALDLH